MLGSPSPRHVWVPGTEPRAGLETDTGERKKRQEEGMDGGEGAVCANNREEREQMGGKEETNGGKQQLVPWDGRVSTVDTHKHTHTPKN